MIPRFALVRPESLAAAFDAFAKTDGDGAYIAGGTELLQVMKMGFAQFATLIDLKRLPELRGIAANGVLRIRAAWAIRRPRNPVASPPAIRKWKPRLVRLRQAWIELDL